MDLTEPVKSTKKSKWKNKYQTSCKFYESFSCVYEFWKIPVEISKSVGNWELYFWYSRDCLPIKFIVRIVLILVNASKL